MKNTIGIFFVSDLIEKGRWRINAPFYIKAAEASETKSVNDYFVIHARQIIPAENAGLMKIKNLRVAFCLHRFLQLRTPGVENIIRVKDHEVHYKGIVYHPDVGYIEMDRVQEWRDYIRMRPELIEFAINDKTSLLCYEEYQL